eukprot:PhF_6_TR33592/c0_g1_i1/m.49040
MSAPTAEEDLRKKEQEVAEKETLLATRRKQCESLAKELEGLRDQIKAAEVVYNTAASELQDLEKERSSLQPKYELALSNREQRAKADKYRQQIEEGEAKLKEYDTTAAQLDQQLQEVSARYKTERDRRTEFDRKLKTMVGELRQTLVNKVSLTTGGDIEIDPFETLLSLSELTKEREREIHNHARHVRELDAIIEMKRRRADELEAEAARQLLSARDAKDNQIKQLIAKFQSERDTLMCDIEQVRRVNQHQLEMLRGSTLGDSGAPSRAEANLEIKAKELAETKKLLQKKCQDVAKDKSELMKKLKQLKDRTKKEEEKFEAALKELDGQIHNERQSAVALERENVKLEEIVESLTQELRKAKQQLGMLGSRRK